MLPERHQGVFLRPQLLPDDLRGAAFSQEPNQMGGLALEPADLGLDRIRAPALRGDQGSHVGLHPRGELRDEVPASWRVRNFAIRTSSSRWRS